MVLLAAAAVWLLNMGFGVWRAFHDLVEGKYLQAALGLFCVIGVNAALGWLIYVAVSTSTDL